MNAASIAASPLGSDRRLALVAGGGVGVSIAALLARVAGVLPAGATTIIVLVGVGVGLRVAFTYVARSASSARRARIAEIVSSAGLAVAAVAVVVSLPRLTQAAGLGTFSRDVLAQLWTLAILMAIAAPVRTLGWRMFFGLALTGFLAITGLARFAGLPLIGALGPSSVLAVGLWVPVTEELFKMLPIFFVLAVAVRRPAMRPSALDVMLVGAWTGAGFALYENAALGRGVFHLTAVPLLSLVYPSALNGHAVGWTVIQSGHLVHSALIGLALAFAVLYRKRLTRPWLVALIPVLVALTEHASQNAMAVNGLPRPIAQLCLVLTLGGRLSSILLLAGAGYVLWVEWRAIGAAGRPPNWISMSADDANSRSALLAVAQRSTPPSRSPHSAPEASPS